VKIRSGLRRGAKGCFVDLVLAYWFVQAGCFGVYDCSDPGLLFSPVRPL